MTLSAAKRSDMRKSLRWGVLFGGLHLALAVALAIYVDSSSDGQSPLLWAFFAVIDFPVSLLYPGRNGVAMWVEGWWPDVYWPYVIHGVLGTAWWFLLPFWVRPVGTWARSWSERK